MEGSLSATDALAVFVAVAAAVVAVGFFLAARQVARRSPIRAADEPDPLVRELTERLRGCEAEVRHWRGTAERLQAELDRRDGGG